MKKLWFIGATLLLLLSSCSTLVPYSTQISSELDMPEDQLKQVKFYVSRAVILEKITDRVSARTENGKVIVKDDKNVERVVISTNTPGKVVKKEEDKLFVSFEDDPNRFLVFGSGEEDDRYLLLAKGWKDGKGKVNYGGHDFQTTQGSGKIYLMMEVKTEQNLKSNTRYAKGRK